MMEALSAPEEETAVQVVLSSKGLLSQTHAFPRSTFFLNRHEQGKG